MRNITFLLVCTLLFFTGFAQNLKRITVSVQNEQKLPLDGATVVLLRSTDSALVKSMISDKSGQSEFSQVAPGSYILQATMVGFETASQPLNIAEADTTSQINAMLSLKVSSGAAMQGVVVTSKKPFIQRLNDRLVVNVESSMLNAGSSALEVLERSPGITIDQNDIISLRGKQGVIIMIDGKPSPMSAADLANYLRSLPSNAIDRIDIITNPSSKYDAAGNSGIIDIHLKKDQRLGSNGTFTAGYGQGQYSKANTGATFNYRKKKVNVFGNYNFSYRKGFNHLILNRNFFENGVFTGSDDKDNMGTMPMKSHTTRIGADFFPSKRTIIGFVVNSSFYHSTRDGYNSSIVRDNQKNPTYTFNTKSDNNDHDNNTFGNINFKHTFDSTGKELTFDADYGVFASRSNSLSDTRYHALDGTAYKPEYILNGNQNGRLTLKSAKGDLVIPMKREARLEAGLKSSIVSSDNDAKFYDISSGSPQNDVNKTNHFLYDENNNAGYVNYSKEYKKFNIQLGLRAEQTNVKTHQKNGDIRWDSSYFQLFPSAFINYKLKQDQTIGVSVSRRINRPGYSDLNPFLFLIDVSTYATGNPGLLPEFTWSYELNYTLRQLNFTLGYSHTINNQNVAIARFSDVFPNIPSDKNVTLQIPVNLASSDYFGLSIAAPVRITKWWNMVNNANIYYNHFNGNLGGSTLNNGSPAADIRSDNSFTLKKGWSAELNGQYSSGGRYGYMLPKPQWAVSAGIQKLILKNKGTIRLNVSDIFWTNLPRATITFPGRYIENWHAYRDSRVANLTFTYRFGNNKVAGARNRATASEEERGRAGK